MVVIVGRVLVVVVSGAVVLLILMVGMAVCAGVRVRVATMIVIMALFRNPAHQSISEDPFLSKIKKLHVSHLIIFTASIVCLLLALEWGGVSLAWTDMKVIALLVIFGITFGGLEDLLYDFGVFCKNCEIALVLIEKLKKFY